MDRIKKGDKIMFLEDYGNHRVGDVIEALSDQSIDSIYSLIIIDDHGYVYAKRVRKVELDNPLNRQLFPELKPDGKGHLI